MYVYDDRDDLSAASASRRHIVVNKEDEKWDQNDEKRNEIPNKMEIKYKKICYNSNLSVKREKNH